MPGKPWTTEEQATFLTGHFQPFLDAQANKEISTVFWPRIYREWFEKYPEKEVLFPGYTSLTEEQEKELQSALNERRKVARNSVIPCNLLNQSQMLRTWFRWRANNTVRKKSTMFKFSTPKVRMLQDTHIYSKLFFDSKLKAIVDEELKNKSATKEERFAVALQVTKREWDNESEEVKAMVRAKKEEMQSERSEPDGTPGTKQDAIDNLSTVAGAFLQHLKETTGWTGFLVVGGPKPNFGGDLAIAS